MTEWTPGVAVISPERQTILDLIQLCKKEMTYHRSVVLALQELSSTGRSALSIQFAEKVKEHEATVQHDVEVLFRQPVSALMSGEAYLQSLRGVLSKHQ